MTGAVLLFANLEMNVASRQAAPVECFSESKGRSKSSNE
jgi:hypothetical protein